MHSHRSCEDPRDKLYSMLAMIGHEFEFDVRYNEDLVELYWRAMKHFSAWCAPLSIDQLWKLLSMDRNLIISHVQEKGHNLSILVPVRRGRVRRRLWPLVSALDRVRPRQYYECTNARRGSGCPMIRIPSNDIFLCPELGKFTDRNTIHFSVRRVRSGLMNGFEIYLHSLDLGTMLGPTDTEIWHIDGATHQKLETWDDVARYAVRTELADENWKDTPHLAVKLSHQYVFDCQDQWEAGKSMYRFLK